MSKLLDELAERHGIALRYEGLDGRFHDVPDATKRAVLNAMGASTANDDELRERLAAAPELQSDQGIPPGTRCYLPDRPERCWGMALQLYALRSERNWGIGDFVDLAAFCATAAQAGADFVGINPLHAGFLADPNRRSPFFPSNRRFLNPLYIAVDRLPGYEIAMTDQPLVEAARQAPLVDYAAVAALKLAALRRLWPVWKQLDELPVYSRAAFDAFKSERGEPLRRHALFEAISLFMIESEAGGSGWVDWPEDYRSVSSRAVAKFAEANGDDVDFHQWLQWLAAVQLAAAGEAATDNGMRIGIYLDFAVGEAPDGSATWGEPQSTMRRVHIGAPPDYFSANGQDWALSPLSPVVLLGDGSGHYRDLVSDSMRYGGALRIDHVMGLHHLFLVPEGQSPAAGTYVRYPMGQMLSDVAAASHRHRTIVIGEDLGNVPRGFRQIMSAVGILSYRILYFERHDDAFAPPDLYPRDALCCLSTHDLPTFEGWWRGDDVRLRHEHQLIGAEAMEEQLTQRALDRNQLCGTLARAGLLTEADTAAAAAASSDTSLPAALLVAIHRYIASTPSRLLAVRIEDLCGEREPVNLPGTVDSYPNWQRKLTQPIEGMEAQPLFRALTGALADERPRQE
ncbi:4-alpha-glucanotransferase [Devosia nitrariae]|uniref:4-alpha-glucanotransferase n=1 Tax=Devosia nitrariae TaxID=2071872 RepID=A0ABQ5W6X3_9HYPH|nr:4-alpha-glucanotransferase [Devosia nitrariae]GLQ55564.1 4-alpha-glucanotransferase [Devosia nitrariae]